MAAEWWREAPPQARRALVASSLGWMLDSFDVMLYAMVVASLMAGMSIDKSTAGVLGSVTLIASAAGGLAFGFIADRYGRTKAMIASVLLYAVFTAACGLARNVTELMIFRILLGLGMGGEWASGAALVSETWPDKHRGKALGLMQSSWAVGYALAAIVTGIVLPIGGWRAVFLVGILPAFLTLWIRRSVEEPAVWKAMRETEARSPFHLADVFGRGRLKATLAIVAMNSCTLFAWWGFNLWVPAYLSLPEADGGIGLSARQMSAMVVAMQTGMWLGYVTFGFASDVAGRKRVYIVYLVTAAAVLAAYGSVRAPVVLLLLGPLVAFFGTGYYSGFGAVTAEMYPTRVRATAQGIAYNTGRIASAFAPYTVGSLADTRGFGAAFTTTAVFFLLAALCWIWIPETKGRPLE